MASSPNQANAIHSIINALTSNYEIEKLVRNDLGSDGFINLKEDITTTFKLLNKIKDFDFKLLPIENSKNLNRNLQNFQQVFLDIVNVFLPDEENKKNITKRFDDNFKELISHFIQINNLKSLEVDEFGLEQFRSTLEFQKQEINELASEARMRIQTARNSVVEENKKVRC